MNKLALESFVIPNYDSNKTKRTEQTYKDVHVFYHKMISDLLLSYEPSSRTQQELREIRNVIDDSLRRVHAYCYRERYGAHYTETGLRETDPVIFEHLIPARVIRDLLLAKHITIEEAFNAPTVILSKDHDNDLRTAGWTKKTPSLIYPFLRYAYSFEAQIMTRCGKLIDMNTWTLEDHYNFFT